MSRATSALPEPPDEATLTELVTRRGATLRAGSRLYRAHRSAAEPWWASSAPADPGEGGRFDLPAPRGTCYLATRPDVALRERLGAKLIGSTLLGSEVATAVAVSVTVLPEDLPVAETTDPAAAGVWTREISTSVDYALTQRWAAAFDRTGAQGVVYESRFTTGSGARALARFARAGPQGWATEGTVSVPDVLTTMGVTVEDAVPGRRAVVRTPLQDHGPGPGA